MSEPTTGEQCNHVAGYYTNPQSGATCWDCGATPDADDASEPLSEDEREALGLVVDRIESDDQSLNEWHRCASCPNRGPCACSGRSWLGDDLTHAVERIIAAREAAAATRARAEAWDEGFGTGVAYERGRDQWFPPIRRPDNPYSIAPDTPVRTKPTTDREGARDE